MSWMFNIKQKFGEALHKINEKFEFYFRVLFNGGRAYLSLIKSEDESAQEAVAGEEESDEIPAEQLRPEEKLSKI